jgi:hydrogenase-1 operon protein HyaF
MIPISIPVVPEAAESNSIGSLRALLREIATLLQRLASHGMTGSIDLNSLPFARGEYEQLRLVLGQGEVSAHIEALGPSEIVETRYPGVWWVTHYNPEGDIIADRIEIAAIPPILVSQQDDIRMGLALLTAQLDEEVDP